MTRQNLNKKVKFHKSKDLFYCLGKADAKDITEREFKISLKKNILDRVDHGFIKTYKPIMDDAGYRIFNKIQEYKNWCEKYLPKWLGYGKAK